MNPVLRARAQIVAKFALATALILNSAILLPAVGGTTASAWWILVIVPFMLLGSLLVMRTWILDCDGQYGLVATARLSTPPQYKPTHRSAR